MRDDENRRAFVIGDVLEQIDDVAAGSGIQRRCRLIGEDQPRTIRQRSRDGNPLPLAARISSPAYSGCAGQAQALEHLGRARAHGRCLGRHAVARPCTRFAER